MNFDKKGWGYTFGDFFTNSSGHPARYVPIHLEKDKPQKTEIRQVLAT
jgi:hypothetical protein